MRAWSTRREPGRGPWQRRSGCQAGEAGPQGSIVLCFSHFSSIVRWTIVECGGIHGICCCIAPAGGQERRGAMATVALLIGWCPPVRGREHKPLQLFHATIHFYTQLQQQGT